METPLLAPKYLCPQGAADFLWSRDCAFPELWSHLFLRIPWELEICHLSSGLGRVFQLFEAIVSNLLPGRFQLQGKSTMTTMINSRADAALQS